MLTLNCSTEFDYLENEIFGDALPIGERVILFDDSEPCGVAVFTLTETINILRVGVVESKRGKRYGDFFTRSVIFKFLPYNMPIVIDYYNKYYENLGFIARDGQMFANSEDIVFPSTCKGACV